MLAFDALLSQVNPTSEHKNTKRTRHQVCMPERVHLIVHPRRKECHVSDFLRDPKAPVGRQAMDDLEQCGEQKWLDRLTPPRGPRIERAFWQSGGGDDRNVDRQERLRSMMDDIHGNPVRRGLVSKATNWL